MRLLEIKAHALRAFYCHLGDFSELGAEFQAALAHQQLKGKTHILGTYRLAIGKGRARIEVKAQPGIVRSTLHATGDQPINGIRLIERTHCQRCI
ncbi:hypothetical protein D3C76_1643490 [compost metagenome]